MATRSRSFRARFELVNVKTPAIVRLFSDWGAGKRDLPRKENVSISHDATRARRALLLPASWRVCSRELHAHRNDQADDSAFRGCWKSRTRADCGRAPTDGLPLFARLLKPLAAKPGGRGKANLVNSRSIRNIDFRTATK